MDSGLRPDRGYVGHKSAKMMKRAKSLESRQESAIQEKAALLHDVERAEPLKLAPRAFHSARLLELDRGVTLLQGKGAYSGKDKQVILCACARTQIIPVKRAVQEIDPDAFVIVCDAHEILGEGFGVYAPGGL